MSVLVKDGCFKLDTAHTTYSFKAVGPGFLMHTYYGKKISDIDTSYVYPMDETRSYRTAVGDDKAAVWRPDDMPLEYSAFGLCDFRKTALMIKAPNGSRTIDLRYVSYEIKEGAAKIPDMPCATENGQDSIETLTVTLKDDALDIFVKLNYVVFEKLDVIARFAEIINGEKADIYIENAASMQLDIFGGDYDFIQLSGAWAKERNVYRTPVHEGTQGFCSRRGTTSHQKAAFFAVCDKTATEETGNVYACQLVYSGNHKTEIEKDQFGMLRTVMGINDEGFSWRLKSGESFFTPEALLTFSANGIGEMSRQYHKFICRHIFREKWYGKRRPLLINNWEATTFNFSCEILTNLAKTASGLGIEMLVMDDGWFGNRNDDHSSLGDWFPHKERLPEGLKSLAASIKKTGMKFGIWMEPEMISEESELYKKHPDWVLCVPGRKKCEGRFQYILDIVKPEVREYVYNAVCKTIEEADAAYLKWDMNRYLTDVFSDSVAPEDQGSVYHRYVLALYDILGRVTERFPDLLIEHCSGGGGRFDAGMLYYSPQVWTSDDSDAGERVKIQFGTSYAYPITSMGSHFSAVPNHQTKRVTPFDTRADVAYCGTFGYELDINKLTDEEREAIKQQCEFYKEHYNLINYGDFYRIAYEEEKFAAWCFASEDKKEILLFCIQIEAGANDPNRFVKIPCADETLRYADADQNQTYFGDTLKNLGICLNFVPGERTTVCKLFKA